MKYGCCYETDNPNNTHNIILNQLTENSKVLDVGCAQGFLGEFIHKNFNCTVVGIDYLKQHIDESANKNSYNELFQIDLNLLSDEMDKYTGYFDFIILADVLEHLYNPQDLINKMKKLLNPNGKIIISIPNITHGSILLNLINNKFNYTPNGLLDNTHIRFYSLYSFVDLLNQENLEILSLKSSVASPNETEQEADTEQIPYNILKYLGKNPHIYCYQYIFNVQISKDSCNIISTNKKIVEKFNKELINKIKPFEKRFIMHPFIKFFKYPRKTIKNCFK